MIRNGEISVYANAESGKFATIYYPATLSRLVVLGSTLPFITSGESTHMILSEARPLELLLVTTQDSACRKLPHYESSFLIPIRNNLSQPVRLKEQFIPGSDMQILVENTGHIVLVSRDKLWRAHIAQEKLVNLLMEVYAGHVGVEVLGDEKDLTPEQIEKSYGRELSKAKQEASLASSLLNEKDIALGMLQKEYEFLQERIQRTHRVLKEAVGTLHYISLYSCVRYGIIAFCVWIIENMVKRMYVYGNRGDHRVVVFQTSEIERQLREEK